MERSSVLRFAAAARRLGDAARAAGLAVPAFRSPPRLPGAPRTIRRYRGGATVSVRLRDRPFDAVLDDMVEGVLVTNGVRGEAADRLRTMLRRAAAGPPPTLDPQARVAERQTQAA